MTKEQFDIFSTKTNSYLKKAKLFYILFIMISITLLIGMFIYEIVTLFITFIAVIIIIALLFQFVFKDYIFYTRKYVEFKRITHHKIFEVSDEVVEFFDKDTYQKLYDLDYELAVKNDVYVLASKAVDDSILTLALAVYFNDAETEAVSATPKALSNDLSGYILKPSIVKVILLVSDEFSQGEKDYLKYSSVFHKNTVVLGLEKNTNSLYYNYFLNGFDLDDFFSNFFKVDLTIGQSPYYDED